MVKVCDLQFLVFLAFLEELETPSSENTNSTRFYIYRGGLSHPGLPGTSGNRRLLVVFFDALEVNCRVLPYCFARNGDTFRAERRGFPLCEGARSEQPGSFPRCYSEIFTLVPDNTTYTGGCVMVDRVGARIAEHTRILPGWGNPLECTLREIVFFEENGRSVAKTPQLGYIAVAEPCEQSLACGPTVFLAPNPRQIRRSARLGILILTLAHLGKFIKSFSDCAPLPRQLPGANEPDTCSWPKSMSGQVNTRFRELASFRR